MTLKEVADHAGVSTSTVSRVINSAPGIAAETVEAVRRSMEALSFKPTIRRKSARIGSSDLVGKKVSFVVLDTPGSPMPSYDALLRGATQAAQHYGFEMSVSFIGNEQAAVERLLSTRPDGLLIHGTFYHNEIARPLHQIATVWMMGNRLPPTWGDQVMPDNVMIGQMAADYLLKNGHKHVMYFGMASSWSFGLRQFAFQQAIEAAGVKLSVVAHKYHTPDSTSNNELDSALKEFNDCYDALKEKPTGIFIAEDWLLRPLYALLQSRGIAVGTGLDVVTCNNVRSMLLGLDSVPAEIDIKFESIGYKAVQQLAVRLVGRGPKDRVRVMLAPTFVPPT